MLICRIVRLDQIILRVLKILWYSDSAYLFLSIYSALAVSPREQASHPTHILYIAITVDSIGPGHPGCKTSQPLGVCAALTSQPSLCCISPEIFQVCSRAVLSKPFGMQLTLRSTCYITSQHIHTHIPCTHTHTQFNVYLLSIYC